MNLETPLGLKKTRLMELPGREEKSDDIFSRLDTVHKCDGQRDGYRPTASNAFMLSVAR